MPSLPDALIRHLRRLPAGAQSDAALLRAYAAGDADAFRLLVARHGPLVLGVCRRVLGDEHAAEDAFQATFLVLARRAGSLRLRGTLPAWLFGVARRTALKARSASGRRMRRESRVAGRANPSREPADELTARELLAALDEELARLPLTCRDPLLLCYWQGLTQDQAARRLGCSAGAIKGRLERGRAKLADRLRRRGFGPSSLLVAPLAAAIVPRDLLARTAALAAAPWSATVPAAVLALAAGPAKLLPAVVLSTLLAGAGVVALAAGAGGPTGAPQTIPPPTVAAKPLVDRYGDPLPPGALARLGTLRFRSVDECRHLTVLTGGREVMLASGPAVSVMDLDSGKIVRRISGSVYGRKRGNPVTAEALSPNGRVLAVGCRDFGADGKTPMAFWLGDARSGDTLREFSARDRPVDQLAFLADGREIAALDNQGIISVWEAATGAKVGEFTGPDRKLVSLAGFARGHLVAAGSEAVDEAGVAYLWDVLTGNRLQTFLGHAGDVKAVAFSPDGRILATGDRARVRLWDVITGRELRKLTGHLRTTEHDGECSIHSLAFSLDGRTIASASSDGTVRAWDVETGRAMDEFEMHTRGHGDLAFRDDRTLLIGSGHTLFRRDIVDRTFARHDGPAYWMSFPAFTPDGRTVVTVEPQGTVRRWNAADGRLLSAKSLNPRSEFTIVGPGGRWVAFTEGEGDQVVTCIGDAATGVVLRRLPEKNQHPAAVSADGLRLATLPVAPPDNPWDLRLTVWDVATGTKAGGVTLIEQPTPVQQDFRLSADGRSVFTAERERPFRLRQWDVATGRVVQEFALPKDTAVFDFVASPDGGQLATIDRSRTLRVWDVATGRECWRSPAIDRLLGGDNGGMRFSLDGSWLATDHYRDRQCGVALWDARTGRHMGDLWDNSGGLIRKAFSPDGRRLVTTSMDGTALIWDIEAVTGRQQP